MLAIMRIIQPLTFPVLTLTATIPIRVEPSNNTRRAASAVLSRDFPIPSIIFVDRQWYAFATEGNGLNVQLARSADFNPPQWQALNWQALISSGPWAATGQTWAPDVVRLTGAAYRSLLAFSELIADQT